METAEKVCAVTKSFDRKNITISMDGNHGEDPSKQSLRRSLKQPQERGQQFHLALAKQINVKRTIESVEGQLLTKMEEEFHCKFVQAEVGICGYAVKKSRVDCYKGKIDAVALRQIPEGDPQVVIVDWKTYAKDDSPTEWWDKATCYKDPLYQCLLYRELLQTHLKVNDINASVGIMLVPLCQARLGQVIPGLCTNFQHMEEEGLLDTIKSYQWFSEESKCVHTVILPCKLLNRERLSDTYLENGVLKETTVVKDIIDDSATVGDMCEELGLLKLKIEDSLAKDDRKSDEEEDKSDAKKKGPISRVKRMFKSKKK